MGLKSNAVVSILQRRLTDYREPFFEALHSRLAAENIRLRLLHGEGTEEEKSRRDGGRIEWAEAVSTRYFGNRRFCWQPFAGQLAGSDLAVIPQENALLANHFALLNRPVEKLAFWGHGANFNAGRHTLSERYKRWSNSRVDWYFAYTRLSTDLVRATGFPEERIVCVNNAIDTGALARDLSSVDFEELSRVKDKVRLGPGPVGIFLGSFHKQKRLGFLLEAACVLREKMPAFELVLAGAGPELAVVDSAVKRYDWVHYLGVCKGRDKAVALKLADIMLYPGGLGLGALDAFVAELPVVTTDCRSHGPEIAYLDVENSVMTPDSIGDFAAGCERLLRDVTLRSRLVQGCKRASAVYTLNNMVENFASGIVRALGRTG